MLLQMSPASGTTMPPNIAQVTKLANSLHGEKPIQIKLKITWNIGSQAFSELVDVTNLPAGL
jgi:AP-1 complex subunit gamma-1